MHTWKEKKDASLLMFEHAAVTFVDFTKNVRERVGGLQHSHSCVCECAEKEINELFMMAAVEASVTLLFFFLGRLFTHVEVEWGVRREGFCQIKLE
jgi:hypothetical protein